MQDSGESAISIEKSHHIAVYLLIYIAPSKSKEKDFTFPHLRCLTFILPRELVLEEVLSLLAFEGVYAMIQGIEIISNG